MRHNIPHASHSVAGMLITYSQVGLIILLVRKVAVHLGFNKCTATFRNSLYKVVRISPSLFMLIKDTPCNIKRCVLLAMLFTYIYRSVPQYVTTQQRS